MFLPGPPSSSIQVSFYLGCVLADTVPAMTFASHPPDSFFPSLAALSYRTHLHKDGARLKNGEEQSFFSSSEPGQAVSHAKHSSYTEGSTGFFSTISSP